jgi:hypothetical protein
VRSPELLAFYRRGERPHASSAAAEIRESEPGVETTVELPADAWFEGEIVDEEVSVHETARRMGNGYTYSLVSVTE